MYKINKINLCAVAAALILAGFGAWIAFTPRVPVAVAEPTAGGIDPIEIMRNAKEPPTQHFVDYSFVFN